MATESNDKTLSYRILDIKSSETSNISLISMEFTVDGEKWNQAFKVEQTHPVTPEELDAHIKNKYEAGEIKKPEDSMKYLREEMGAPRSIIVPALRSPEIEE